MNIAKEDVSLRDLKVLAMLLEVGSLTKVAQALGIGQPNVSKILRRLRAHFGDPLLVRAGQTMRPTPKASQLLDPVRELLRTSDMLRASTRAFDPQSSQREFALLVTEVGMLSMVPDVMRHLEAAGRNLRLRALPLDAGALETRLEAGDADLAIGAWNPSPALRRQSLFADRFATVVRRGHPRLREVAQLEGFRRERHIAVTASQTGHLAHCQLERALSAEIPADHLQVRVPSFLAAAFLASRTDAVATIPSRLASLVAKDFGLETVAPALSLPPIEIAQFWHERFQQDAGHRWFRTELFRIFSRNA